MKHYSGCGISPKFVYETCKHRVRRQLDTIRWRAIPIQNMCIRINRYNINDVTGAALKPFNFRDAGALLC